MFSGNIRIKNGKDLQKTILTLLSTEGTYEVGLPERAMYRRSGKEDIPMWRVAEIVSGSQHPGRAAVSAKAFRPLHIRIEMILSTARSCGRQDPKAKTGRPK